ncbi:uncharacterized protein LOC133195977 [Saccostrea echinata]|uniref:uncharacterized protein LOC133195977 n=1 Tax=Saccostrea echinata TaxID=191078 RepID=UPI002A820327|nr:uncharacterized protein LOC133195977 [Saccostrea echinata]
MAIFLSMLVYMGVLLFFIGIPSHKCMTLSGYRMEVYPVTSCPKNDTEWQRASRKLNCSEIVGKPNHYHCLPIHDLSQLVQFCYNRLSGLVESGLCVILSQSSILDIKECGMFASGCPDKNYIPTMMYQFPACLEIIGSSGCYSADPACRKVNPPTQTERIIDMLHVIIPGIFLLLAAIYTCITLFICQKRTPKDQTKNLQQNSTKHLDETDESNHMSTSIPRAVLDNSIRWTNYSAELFNVKANTIKDLLKHAEDNTYTRTSAVTEAMTILKRQQIIILTGKEGEGKTKTAHQVMFEMLESHTPLKIRNREQWDRIVNANCSYVVCLDDAINPTYMNDSKEFLDHIYSCVVKGKLCAILVFRTKMLEELKAIYPIFELFNSDYIIDLTGKMKLSEKGEMLKQYEKGTGRKLKSISDREEILSTDTYFGFPFTCSLFFAKDDFFNQGPTFFRCTSSILYARIDGLKKMEANLKSKVCYCVLCYILVNGPVNTRKKYDLKEIENMVGVAHINQSNFIEALKYMKGLYLIKTRTDRSYDFIHETVRETVLTSFGKVAPGMIIQKCRRETLKSVVRPMSYKQRSGEIVLKISNEHYQPLAKKLLLNNENNDEIVNNIIVNSASYDFEFFKELLTHSISGLCNPSQVLRLLWDKLLTEEKTVLLDCMLNSYGPHVGLFSPKYDEKIHFNISFNDIDNLIENALRFRKRDKILSIVQYVRQHDSLHAVASFTHKQHKSMTLLHCCVVHGWEDVVYELLTFHEATVTEDFWSIFHFAAYAGRHTLVKNFQNRGLIYDKTDAGYSLLQCTLLGLRHSSKTTKPFLDVDKKYCLPFSIEFAAEDDYCELIKYLHTLSDRIDWVKELTMTLDRENNTVQYYLRLHGYNKILKLLQDLNIVNETYATNTA